MRGKHPSARFCSNDCRYRNHELTSRLRKSLEALDEPEFRAAIRDACIARWGSGRLRIRYGGGD